MTHELLSEWVRCLSLKWFRKYGFHRLKQACSPGCVHLPSSLVQVFEIRSREYASPVIMYLPVSPVAPPNSTALVLFTMKCQNTLGASRELWSREEGELTKGHGVAEASKWHVAIHIHLLHQTVMSLF